MSFTPEDDLEVYNKLNQYYEVADDLTIRIDDNKEISLKQKQEILYPIIDQIKELADQLVESYICHLKDRNNMEKLIKVRENIDEVLEKIDYFKNKVYEAYKLNNK